MSEEGFDGLSLAQCEILDCLWGVAEVTDDFVHELDMRPSEVWRDMDDLERRGLVKNTSDEDHEPRWIYTGPVDPVD